MAMKLEIIPAALLCALLMQLGCQHELQDEQGRLLGEHHPVVWPA